ncbi:MAG: MFS transporter [Actinobacteria bacterium]|nr:MAG: MFS transporter [Actinomycetota bacterium]
MELPLRTKLLYATSNIGNEALARSRSLWLIYFYAPPRDSHLPTLLPSLVIGLVLAAGAVVGSLDAVIVGYFSDRTRSRWGRRIPYVIAGAPLWAVFAVLIFVPPTHPGTAVTAVYVFFMLEFYALFSTLAAGPYEALLPELAPTSPERVSLQAIKVYLGLAGTAIGLVGSTILRDAVGFRWMAVAMAGLALVCRYVGLAGVWGRAKLSQTPARMGFREALRATAANAPYRILLPSVVLFAIAFDLLQALIPFYVHAIVGKHSWLSTRVLLAVAIVSAVACVPLFAGLARRTSKRAAYRSSILAAGLAFPLLGVAGLLPGIPKEVQILVATVFVAAPIGAHFLFPIPLTADVIDHDSGRTNLRREATYLGANSFVERMSTSLAPPLLVLLRLLGDTRDHTLGVRLVAPVGGLIVLAGYVLFRKYDVPDEVRLRVVPEPAALALGVGEGGARNSPSSTPAANS